MYFFFLVRSALCTCGSILTSMVKGKTFSWISWVSWYIWKGSSCTWSALSNISKERKSIYHNPSNTAEFSLMNQNLWDPSQGGWSHERACTCEKRWHIEHSNPRQRCENNAPYHLCKGAFSQDYHIQNANTTLFLDLEVILSQGQNHMFRSLSSRNRWFKRFVIYV